MVTLQTEHFMLAVPRGHRLSTIAAVHMADLVHEDFIFYTEDAPGLRRAALHACEIHGFTPRIAQEAVQVALRMTLFSNSIAFAV